MTLPDSTAWTMILAAGAGEDTARDRFARSYGGVIRAYLASRWHLPVTHEAVDDATQEVFIQCFKPLGALTGLDPAGAAQFRTYLFAIVKHVADRIERRERTRRTAQEGSQGLDAMPRDDATLSRVFDRAWVAMITRSAWLLMASRTQDRDDGPHRIQILDLRFRDGLASGEIAERLGLETAYVYQQLRNAKRDFRTALVEVVSQHYPGATKEEIESRCLDLVGLL